MHDNIEKEISPQSGCVVGLIAVFMLIPSCLLWGFTVKCSWAMLAPIVYPGVPLLTWAQGAALRMLIMVVWPMYLPNEPIKGSAIKYTVNMIFRMVFTPVLYLFTAWVVYMVVR